MHQGCNACIATRATACDDDSPAEVLSSSESRNVRFDEFGKRDDVVVVATDLTVDPPHVRDVKNVPSRKTDVSDAAWLADLGARRPRLSLSQHVV